MQRKCTHYSHATPFCKFCTDSGGHQFAHHPVQNEENYRTQCIPIGLHGDGTPSSGAGKSWSKMIDDWSWFSLLVKEQPKSSMFLIWGMHSCLRDASSLDTAFKKMRWSLDACFDGHFPRKDHNGNKLRSTEAPPLAMSCRYICAGCAARYV